MNTFISSFKTLFNNWFGGFSYPARLSDYRGKRLSESMALEEDVLMMTEGEIEELQVSYMSPAELIKLRPAPERNIELDEQAVALMEVIPLPEPERSLVIDPLSYMSVGATCLRSRAVALLRLLEDDVRGIENNRVMQMDDLVTEKQKANYGSVLNALVWEQHKALYTVLKEIKAAGGEVLEQFHLGIENLGYFGGYRKDDNVIRIGNQRMPYGLIEV